MESLIKQEVELRYNELQEYAKLFNTKSEKDRTEIMERHAVKFKENPEEVDTVTIAKEMLYINGFHQADIRKMQQDFLSTFVVSKKIFPELEYSEDIEKTAKVLQQALPAQVFVVDNGVFKEVEKGRREKLMSDFDEKGYFKLFEAQISKLLG